MLSFFTTLLDYRQTIARACAVLALGLMLLSALCFSALFHRDFVVYGFWLLIAGGCALAIALIAGYNLPSPDAPGSPTPGSEDTQPNQPVRRASLRIREARGLLPSRAVLRALWRVRLVLFVLGALGMALLAETSGGALRIPALLQLSHHVQFVLLCVSLLLIIAGLSGGVPRERRAAQHAGLGQCLVRWLWLLLPIGAVTALAFALRVWSLESGLHYFLDELNFASAVRHFWLRPDVELLAPFSTSIAFPWLYPYFQAQAAEAYGRTLFALRLPSAILGTLTVPALWLLLRETLLLAVPVRRRVQGAGIALAGALLLATFPPHLHFSRIGLNNIADPLFGTLAFAVVARGVRRQSMTAAAVAGVCLGLTQYFYEGGRLFFPLLLCLWTAGVLILRAPRLRWWHLRYALTFVLAALVVAVPIYYVLLAQGQPLTVRMGRESLSAGTLVEQGVSGYLYHLQDALLAYVNIADTSTRHLYYGDWNGLVFQYGVPLFLLGLVTAVLRLRHPGLLLPLLWIAAAAAGNSFLRYSSVSARFVVAFPAIAALLAVGLWVIWRLLVYGAWREVPAKSLSVNSASRARHASPLQENLTSRIDTKQTAAQPESALRYSTARGGRLHAGFALSLWLLLALTAAGQTLYYFGDHLPLYNWRIRANDVWRDGQDAIFRAVELPPGTHIHLFSAVVFNERFAADMMSYLADGYRVHTLATENLTEDYLRWLPRDVPHAFFIEPGDSATLALIVRYFVLQPPQYTPYPHIAHDRQYVLYFAPLELNSVAVGGTPEPSSNAPPDAPPDAPPGTTTAGDSGE